MDAYLVRLVRGEGGTLWPSAQERLLIKYALDNFGESLSQLLLAGLGEETEAHNWRITVTFADEKGAVRCREIRVEADDHPDVATLLPRQREPLVMIALLRLLIVDRKLSSSSLSYELDEVLGLLGWEGSAESQLTLDIAIKRYACISYLWTLSEEELDERNLSFYKGQSRLISGYGHYEIEEGSFRRLTGSVEFGDRFIEGLSGRTLFDINWNSVSEINLQIGG